MFDQLVLNNEAAFVRDQILDIVKKGQGIELSRCFYRRLFEADAGLQSLFKSDMESLNKKMVMTLKAIFDAMPDRRGIDEVAPKLTVPHLGLGLTEYHYDLFVTCLIRAVEDVRGYRMPSEAAGPLRRYFLALGAEMRGLEARLANRNPG